MKKPIQFDNTALFTGAGFSNALGLNTSTGLEKSFTNLGKTEATPNKKLQAAISTELINFWKNVFGWTNNCPINPSLEDHFTLLDLSANAGHNLGMYSPRQLRAIRRLSIHRVFDVLDQNYKPNAAVNYLIHCLSKGENNLIVSTNWDTAVERSM